MTSQTATTTGTAMSTIRRSVLGWRSSTPAVSRSGRLASRSMPKIDRATPILRVADVTASVAYYRERLGFETTFTYGDPPGFGGVQRDGVEVFLCREGQGNPGTWMSLWVDDVDALHDEFRERGAEIRQPPTTFDWGVREMNVGDPDGHRLRFSMPTRGPADGVPLRED